MFCSHIIHAYIVQSLDELFTSSTNWLDGLFCYSDQGENHPSDHFDGTRLLLSDMAFDV